MHLETWAYVRLDKILLAITRLGRRLLGCWRRRQLDVDQVRVAADGRVLHARQHSREFSEQRLDVEPGLGARLDEHDVLLLGLVRSFLNRHLAAVRDVCLVAHEHDHHVLPTLRTHVLNPLGRVQERRAVRDVVRHDRDRRVADVARDEAAEALLPGRVPELQPHRAILHVHGLGQEVDADRGLVRVVERVVHEPRDDRRLAHALIAQEHQLVLGQRRDLRHAHAAAGRDHRVLLALVRGVRRGRRRRLGLRLVVAHIVVRGVDHTSAEHITARWRSIKPHRTKKTKKQNLETQKTLRMCRD